jgi:NADH dehydrogenase
VEELAPAGVGRAARRPGRGADVIAVLGATGFVGGHLLARLRDRGEPVRCAVRTAGQEDRLSALGFEVVRADVTEPAGLRRLMDGARAVVNLVTVTRETRVGQFRRVHYEGMRNLVSAARDTGVRRVIHIGALGTDTHGTDPRHQYLYWKRRAKEALEEAGLDHTVFETSIVFGPGDQLLTVVALGLKWLPVFPLPAGPHATETRFQPVWVGDLVHCVVRSLDDPGSFGRTFPLGGPQVWPYRALVEFVDRLLGTRRRFVHVPVWLVRPALASGRLYMRYPPVTDAMLDLMLERVDSVADSTATYRHFELEPADLPSACGYLTHVGVREWVQWQRRRPGHGAFAGGAGSRPPS